MKPFWMVWNPQGYNPTREHETLESAQREAERLARQCRGQNFVVLESVEVVTVDDVKRTDLRPTPEPPF